MTALYPLNAPITATRERANVAARRAASTEHSAECVMCGSPYRPTAPVWEQPACSWRCEGERRQAAHAAAAELDAFWHSRAWTRRQRTAR